jgi:hypothetical protein
VQPPTALAFAAYVAVVVLSLALMIRGRARIVGTTLAAAWAWAFAALLLVCGIEIALWFAAENRDLLPAVYPSWTTPARYAAAVLALCPTVALLGAKRPQDRAWQWVVLSFWAIMLVPAARSFLLLGGEMALPHAAQGVFLLVIVAMGAANWIATRFTWAAVAVGAAQATLIGPYTPLSQLLPHIPPLVSLVPVLLALIVCRRQASPVRPSDPLERDWLDFRDAFGLFWAARVMARLNTAARQHGWPVVFAWRGVQLDDADLRAREAASRSLRMLLRRFVSNDWLTERNRAA